MLYRASEHGFSARKFHAACDLKGSTVVLVKAAGSDALFGGYNAYEWNGEWGAYIAVRRRHSAEAGVGAGVGASVLRRRLHCRHLHCGA